MLSSSSSSYLLLAKWQVFAIHILLFSTCLAYTSPQQLHAAHLQQHPLLDTSSKTHEFNWSDITPTNHLTWTPCHTHFQCARLSVPLNHDSTLPQTHPSSRAAIALIRLPALVPLHSPHHGGSILFNPGGPGESGIHQILTGGRFLRTIVDSAHDPSSPELPEDAKFFDLIGFDPRGVKNTTPHLKCFPDGIAQQAWLDGYMDYAVVWESDEAIAVEWARAQALGRSCVEGEDSVARFVNTEQVVGDMLEIVERIGEWREGEVERVLASEERSEMTERKREELRERAAWRRGEEKIQYWGQSYGTILGQTFAAMYPDRVGRLIIDGVVSPEDYYSGRWLANLVDSDKAMTKLTEYCFDAGPEKCPLYRGSSAADIEQWITDFVFGFQTDPLAVAGTGSGPLGPEAEKYFRLLADISQGNVSALVAEKQAGRGTVKLSSECKKAGPYSDACISDSYFGLLGGTQSIECMDSAGGAGQNLTKDGFKAYYKQLNEQSRWYASTWARHRMSCVGIPDVHPAWKFDGPIAGNTSHPLLIIGNSHDTVTPIQNARHATQLFPGAALIHQNSEGHCSYSNPSVCTGKMIREYFQTGTVPENGAVCEPDHRPWIGCVRKDKNGRCAPRSAEDERLWSAWLNLTKIWP